MKYCLDFDNRIKNIIDADEIRINYNKQKTDAIEYIIDNQDKCIILYIDDIDNILKNKDLKKLSSIAEENEKLNFKVEFNNYTDELIEQLTDVKFKYFFNIYANCWDIFLGLISLGVSDIYITEDLGFELDRVAEIAHKNNVNIRCFPNIAQSAWKNTNSLKKFFIRPDDIDKYEKYIDTLCFIGEPTKIDIYYKVYKYDKQWYGKLNELILDFDIDLDGKFTIPRFAEKRIRCRKECMKGGKCQMCERILELSKTLEKANLVVKI